MFSKGGNTFKKEKKIRQVTSNALIKTNWSMESEANNELHACTAFDENFYGTASGQSKKFKSAHLNTWCKSRMLKPLRQSFHS